jgi:hypothetical protein
MTRHLRNFTIILIGSLALKSQHLGAVVIGYELAGRWNYESASQEFPATCIGTYFDFRTNGRLLGSDGSRDEIKSWSATKVDEGFHLKLEFISDNEKTNCQGLSSEYVRKNSIKEAYVELLEDGKLLKFYFAPRKSKDYLLFRKKP